MKDNGKKTKLMVKVQCITLLVILPKESGYVTKQMDMENGGPAMEVSMQANG